MRTLRLASAEGAPFIACATFLADVDLYAFTQDGPQGSGYYRMHGAPPPDPYEQARAILAQASDAGAAFIACDEPIDQLPMYEFRNGPEGMGYYRDASAPPPNDPIEAARLVLREAAAAAAEFVRCPEAVGELAGYDWHADGPDGPGYYRRADAPPPDAREYSRMVLQRASAAHADFVACDEAVMDLVGYEHRDGHEGRGYYRIGYSAPPAPAPPPAAGGGSFDAFLSTMRELGAV